MNWKEYDERAEWLEQQFKAEVPLFDWKVLRADTMVVVWREQPTEGSCPYRMRASVVVNGERLWADAEVDASIVEIWETQNMTEYVSRLIAHNMVQRMMEWKPE